MVVCPFCHLMTEMQFDGPYTHYICENCMLVRTWDKRDGEHWYNELKESDIIQPHLWSRYQHRSKSVQARRERALKKLREQSEQHEPQEQERKAKEA